MTKLNIIGDIFSGTGYSSHVRQLANALYEQGIDVTLDVPKPQGWQTAVNDAEYNMLTKEIDWNETTLMIGLPPVWQFPLSEKPKNFIGFLVWEGDSIPKSWVPILAREEVKQIWVPSKHVKEAIKSTLASELFKGEILIDNLLVVNKIRIIPHGVDKTLFYPRPQSDNRPFTFICDKGWAQGMQDRGGIQWAVKAFIEEFTKEDNVKLKIKLNPSYGGSALNPIEEFNRLGFKKENGPLIEINNSLIDYNELTRSLYHEGDVFLSPNMGEAFNLGGLQAMSCGIPNIQTNFGGQTDYVNESNGWLIDYELVDVVEPKADVGHPYFLYQGVKWAKPNIEHLKKIMRYCYEHQDEVKAKGKKAYEDTINKTWKDTAKKAIEALKELG